MIALRDVAFYQARSGGIVLTIGNYHSYLCHKEVQLLGLDIYALEDFSEADYKKYYKVEEIKK
jgi:hypothetical protein